MEPILIAVLTFVTVAGILVAIWWVLTSEMAIRARLTASSLTPDFSTPTLQRAAADRFPLLAQIAAAFPWTRRLERLTQQAGWDGRLGEALGLMILLAVVGGLVGALRIGGWLWTVTFALTGAMIPVGYLRFLRYRRIEMFTEQFPEALDMMTRSLRAGYALGPAFQLVSEEMPDPVGSEFKRVFEEISLGRPPNEAMREMCERVKTEETRFFYVAVGIQRDVGGNLAEILDKLSEVIRERFKLLAFARTISVQQRMSAYCVAAAPFVTALALVLLRREWFDPLWAWPYGKLLVFGLLVQQLIGFYFLRRIANITV